MKNFEQTELKFKECRYGYIVTDGVRMCKITAEEKLNIDICADADKHSKFIELWRCY